MTTTEDRCPEWAHELILRLRDLEIELGHVPPPDDGWRDAKLSELTALLDDAEGKEAASERLFRELCRRLSEADFGPDEIATLINQRIPCPGKLSYCNAAEVKDALYH